LKSLNNFGYIGMNSLKGLERNTKMLFGPTLF